MSEFVVVTFPDEAKAYEGRHALQVLHDEGSLTVYATAVVRREPGGSLTVKESSPDGPIGTVLGMLVGALVGAFGGPVGMAAGATAGTVLGGTRDLLHLGVSDDFLGETEKDISPGKYAVIAEISEDWTAPLDLSMNAIGGKVIREPLEEFVDEQFQRRADAWKRQIQRAGQERASARAERMEARTDAQVEEQRKRLQAFAQKARRQLEDRKTELNSKLKALQDQAAKAEPAVRGRIDQRISDLRHEFDNREQKLKRAYELTQEALGPA